MDREATKPSQEAAPLDQSRLLMASNTTKKTIYHLAPSRWEEIGWPLEALNVRSRRGSTDEQGTQGTRLRTNQMPPQNSLAMEAMTRNHQLGVDGPTTTLRC
jgi:hypothetical protein